MDPENTPKKVGIIYSYVERSYFPTEQAYITEKEAEHDATIIAEHLRKIVPEVNIYPGSPDLPEILKKDKPDMVFNLVDTVKGSEYLASAIPGMLDLLSIPYTGADLLGFAICCNKFLTKKLLQQAGVPTPAFQFFFDGNEPLDLQLRFPLISKLNESHGGVEITKEAVSENEKHLRDRIKYLISTYKQPVLVEEFIVGREITAFILEGIHKKVYFAEKVFNKPDDKFVFATFEDQWMSGPDTEDESTWSYHYEKFESDILKEYSKKAYEVTKMDDYAKFDIRMDSSGRFYFIDTNCNPAFGPRELQTAMSYILELYGVSFQEMLRRLIVNTLRGPTD